MNKQKRINQFEREHTELEHLVNSLSEGQITQENVFGDWTVKDIVAHITAWTQKAIEELDDLDSGKKPWIVGVDIDAFNQKVVEERRKLSWGKIHEDWRSSWAALIQRIRQVPDEQWKQATGFFWSDGASLTRASLFDYEYEGANHEGGHTKQIQEHFAR